MITALHRPLPRTLVLVGLMGAGKTAVGKRVAARLGLGFTDADHAIEEAAGCSIPDIFERYGEPAFRDLERRVIARLMHEPVQVLSTGGGAFMDAQTRATVAERGLSLWLKAELEVLATRTAKRHNRPLLRQGDPKAVLAGLMERRHPIYALADLTVDSRDGPVEETVERVLAAIDARLAAETPASETDPGQTTPDHPAPDPLTAGPAAPDPTD
ncbi:shikimate kinase [Inquilinus ginsengisoli]|uniref:Shikimate kinase n=1 Tax=Inquilinus ginsengisoli TaxID=363840 RepID=A0ABU1JZF8_9PROT|nr:shikimate kinase [Inquilinus ginsengisoli]MDR6293988.1 shikimate kinase [Inquilinus ginsengisoli]